MAGNISFVLGGKMAIFVGIGDLLADGNWEKIGVQSMDMSWLSNGVRMYEAQSLRCTTLHLSTFHMYSK